MSNISYATDLKAELDSLRPIKKEYELVIMQKLKLDWNFHSNHLEGNSLTYGETKALLLFGITAQGKPLKDHFEISGHDEAINLILDVIKDERSLSENFIRELHKLILKEPYEVKAITPEGKSTTKLIRVGEFKKVPNHVLTSTGEIFRFATPEETPALMFDLINWYSEKKSKKNVTPILLAAEFHYKFIRIHPFDDGNGRIARILMNFILMSFGYPPVIIKTEDKSNYFSVLRIADSGDINPFVEYIAGNLVNSLEIFIKGAKGESIEEPDDIDKEIALLESRLDDFGKKIGIVKTKESIVGICYNTLKELLKYYEDKSNLFNKFYESEKAMVIVDGTLAGNVFVKDRDLWGNIIKDNTLKIEFRMYYNNFNKKGIRPFSNVTFIVIEFEIAGYTIKNSSNNIIKKSYNESITQEDINIVVGGELRRHKAIILDAMKKAENTK